MNTTLFDIKFITAEETFKVRQPVLRAGRPLKDCEFDGDNLPSTFHLGLFHKNELTGVATFIKNSNSYFEEQLQYQLRGMAVLKEFQGLSYGKALLNFGENHLKTINIPLLWFNAREIAVPFYKKSGYEIFGSSFLIDHIGLHYSMYKKL
ncbi:MAG TPA: GNAT family N-acetyltransferase [Flavobacteriaceae bacterium]|nr:GNAT family N-acetyltransferase [Flavobacteriaceae bacterium]